MRVRTAQPLLAVLCLLSLSRGQSLAADYRAATFPQILSVAVVENIDLTLDGMHLHLEDGFLGWGSPVEGQPTALVFQGHGRLDIALPDAVERQQVQLFSHRDDLHVYLQSAVFRFADRSRLLQALGQQAHFFYPAPRGAPELERVLAGRLDATAKAGRATPVQVLDGLTGGAADLLLNQFQTSEGKWIYVDVDPREEQPLRVYTMAKVNVPLGDLPWYKYKTVERFDNTWAQLSPPGIAAAPAPWEITDYKFAFTLSKKPEFRAQETLTLQARGDHRGILLNLDGKYRVTSAMAQGQPLAYVQARDPSPEFGEKYDGNWLYLEWPVSPQSGQKVQLVLTVEDNHAGQRQSQALRDWIWPDQAWYPALPPAGATQRARYGASVELQGKLKPWNVLQAHAGANPAFPVPMANFGLMATLPAPKAAAARGRSPARIQGASPGLAGRNYLTVMSQMLADARDFYIGQLGRPPLRRLDLAIGPTYFQNSRVTGRDLRQQAAIGRTLGGLMQARQLESITGRSDLQRPDDLTTVGGAGAVNTAGLQFALPQAGRAGPRSIFGSGGAPPGFEMLTPLEQAQILPPIAGEMPGEKTNLFRAEPGPSPMSGLLQRDGPSWPGLAVVNPAWARLGLLGYPSMIFIPYGELWPTQEQLFDYTPAHVVSRQWWGDWVGSASRNDAWVIEALASGSAMNFGEYEFGDLTAGDLRATWIKELTTKDAFWHVPNAIGPLALGTRLASSLDPAAYDVIAEDKGGYVIEMLRAMMGEARFRAAMHELTEHYGGRNLSVAGFEQVMTSHMSPVMDLDHDHSLNWFFNEYVKRNAIDTLQVSWHEVSTAGHGTVIELTVKNPGGWRGLLPLYLFQTKKHAQRALVPITSGFVQVRVVVPFHPRRIAADPWHEMLVKVVSSKQ